MRLRLGRYDQRLGVPVVVSHDSLNVAIACRFPGEPIWLRNSPHVKTSLDVFFKLSKVFLLEPFMHFVLVFLRNILILRFTDYPNNRCLDLPARQDYLLGEVLGLPLVLPLDEIVWLFEAERDTNDLPGSIRRIFLRFENRFGGTLGYEVGRFRGVGFFYRTFSALDIPAFVLEFNLHI